jgi:hypothetical protein
MNQHTYLVINPLCVQLNCKNSYSSGYNKGLCKFLVALKECNKFVKKNTHTLTGRKVILVDI